MALDINGYNSAFKSFVEFAQNRTGENQEKAIADARIKKFNGEEVLTIAHVKTDDVHKWLRTGDECDVNDRTRAIFRAAVVNMFGGESKVPESVKKAMLMEDYDKGKPLTARRILAVKEAIDADGTAKARSATIRFETLDNPANEAAMLAKGYTKAELPRLARAARFYAEVNHCAEFEALEALTTPGTKANRLMQYGGRFLESAENFANGLRLMDSFASWFTAVCETKAADREGKFENAKTVTDFNFVGSIASRRSQAGLERIVFEELAVNPGANLAETDPEKIFGMKDNAASRFIGTRRYGNFLGVVVSVPPARRGAIFAVFDKLSKPLPETKEAALAFNELPPDEKGVRDPNLVISRILRHLPEIEKLMAKGALTTKNIVKTLFPDLPSRDWTLRGMNEFTHNVEDLCVERLVDGGMDEDEALSYGGRLRLVMEETSCTFNEAFATVTTGKRVAPPPYMTTATYPIEELDGTTNAARTQLQAAGSGDLYRAYNYGALDDPENAEKFFIKDPAGQAFGFNFPDGTFLRANSNVHAGNVPTILDKLESLAGRVHPRQQSALLFAVSQAGISTLRGGLAPYGIVASEHACVDFTISKDDETGAITVKYTGPEELPVRFSWTATIDVDGNMTTTPMVVDQPVAQLTAKAARAKVDAAANGLGVKLTGAQANEAAGLLRTHGTDMYSWNADIFAKFLVRLVTAGGQGANKDAIAADTANSIRKWRSVGLGDSGFAAFNEAAKNNVSNTIRKYMQPDQAGRFKDGIHETMFEDAHRAIYTFNGTTYNHKPANELIPAFKALVPDAKKQRALSIYLNQLCLETVLMPTTHVPYETGVEAHKLPGSDALVNRDMTSGLYQSSVLYTYQHVLTHDLKLSEDGRTATITQSITADLSGPGADMNDPKSFGQVTFSQRLVIDLEPDIPVVTDYKLSQTIE